MNTEFYDKNNPKITVLMAVYNGEKYLKKAIDSILNQTFKNFEFLIINDGSTDNTVKILQNYKDPRIKIVTNKKNLGLVKSLNKGLDIARGEYIARMDADDISLPNRLRTQLDFMKKNKKYVVVGSSVEVIDEKGNIITTWRREGDPLLLKWKLIVSPSIMHSTAFFKKNIIIKEGKYNIEFKDAEDFELWSRLSDKYLLSNIEKPLVQYRIHDSSVMGTLRKINDNEAHFKVIRNNLSKYIDFNEEDVHLFKLFREGPQTTKEGKRKRKILKKILKSFLKKNNLNKKQKKILKKQIPKRRIIRMLKKLSSPRNLYLTIRRKINKL